MSLLCFILLWVVAYIACKILISFLSDLFSDTKRCPRCEGKGWWQNTRNRDKCEWCQGSGRIPKNADL
ncbi:MAG: hypothetical protein D6730_14310 [Bacteroidetes bacterium]|nr:MAG: hypothetical protein D6730_14310 [Bacteroidota bacterium]